MNSKSQRKFGRLASLLGVSLILFESCARIYLPYGHREAFLRSVDSDLQNYARDHDGRFPNADDPYTALASLYPEYSDSGYELAGLSGNIAQVTNALRKGNSISNLTSWVYVPGLRQDDDARLAILWESKAGLSPNGNSANLGTRPVLLLSRDITNVASSQWEDFLIQQDRLREAVLPNRINHAKTPPEAAR